jgi:histidine triad (HIT) family protein
MDNFGTKLLGLKITKKVIGQLFSKASFLIPQKKLIETACWIVFIHPKPTYPVHLVILPKRPIADWLTIPSDDPELFKDFVELTQGMIREFCLEETGYRLIMNGGKYQTFPHLHFHLVAGDLFK